MGQSCKISNQSSANVSHYEQCKLSFVKSSCQSTCNCLPGEFGLRQESLHRCLRVLGAANRCREDSILSVEACQRESSSRSWLRSNFLLPAAHYTESVCYSGIASDVACARGPPSRLSSGQKWGGDAYPEDPAIGQHRWTVSWNYFGCAFINWNVVASFAGSC